MDRGALGVRGVPLVIRPRRRQRTGPATKQERGAKSCALGSGDVRAVSTWPRSCARRGRSWVEGDGSGVAGRVGQRRRRAGRSSSPRTATPGPAGLGPSRLRARAARSRNWRGGSGCPVISLVDVPGADPSPAAENAGIAREIAVRSPAFAALPTVSVSVCVGEGGSGGALRVGGRGPAPHPARRHLLGDRPRRGGRRSCAETRLWLSQVAATLRLTSRDLFDLGIADEIIGEDEDDVGAAVLRALASAEPGDRLRRADAVSQRLASRLSPASWWRRWRWQFEDLARHRSNRRCASRRAGPVVVDQEPPVREQFAVGGRAVPCDASGLGRRAPETLAGAHRPCGRARAGRGGVDAGRSRRRSMTRMVAVSLSLGRGTRVMTTM